MDECAPLAGCVYIPLDCDDGNLCTADLCENGKCRNKKLKCPDDHDKCTLDECDPRTGLCAYMPIVPCRGNKTDLFETADTSREVMLRAYPNPFREKLNIEFSLPEASAVKLEIFSITGQRIAALFEGEAKALQPHLLEFKPHTCSGIVICRLQTRHGVYNSKAVMMK